MRIALLLVLAACGDDPVHHLDDAMCVPALSDYEITLTAPASYACHADYAAKLTLVNHGCAAATITDIKLATVTTTGNCTPPGPGTFPGGTVAANATGDILDFVGGAFCCTSPGCPTPFQCDETQTYTIETPLGTITKSSVQHLSLDGCNEICPVP